MRRIITTVAVILATLAGAEVRAATSAYSSVVLAANPTVYWQMDESVGATTAIDSAPTGGTNNGTYNNTTLGVSGSPMVDNPGNTGAGLAFASTSTITASASDIGSLSTAYTAEMWFNNEGSDANLITGYFYNRGSGAGQVDAIGIDGADVSDAPLIKDDLFILADGAIFTTHFTVVNGTWYQVAFVRNASDDVSLYVNGVAQDLYDNTNTNLGTSIHAPASYAPTAGAILLGTSADNTWYFTGTLDEFALFNSALSGDQIQNQFDHAFVVPEPASLGLLVIGAAAVLGLRRRSRSMRTALVVGALGFIFGMTPLFVQPASAITVVADYHLGEVDPGAAAGNPGNSTTIDSSATQDDLTRFGSPAYSSDTPGGSSTLSMSLDGSSYYETATVPTNVNSNFVAEIWVKAAAIQGSAVVMSSGSTSPTFTTWSIWENSGQWGLLFENGSVIASSPLAPVSTTDWTQLALVVDTSTSSLYVNGALIFSEPFLPPAPSSFLSIGSEHGVAKFDGLVDEARVFTFTGTFNPSDLNNLTFTVPEPASLGLLAIGAAAVLGRRRRA